VAGELTARHVLPLFREHGRARSDSPHPDPQREPKSGAVAVVMNK
jgi:hypothetical protein